MPSKHSRPKINLCDTFSGDLFAPGSNAVLGHVALVIFVKRKSTELSINDRLALGKVVSTWVNSSHHGGTSSLLSGKVQPGDFLENLIPGSSGSSLVGSGVPGWGSNNERVIVGQVANISLTNVSRVRDISRELLLNPVGSGLSVTSGGSEEESDLGGSGHAGGRPASADSLDGETSASELRLSQYAGVHGSELLRYFKCCAWSTDFLFAFPM